MSIYIIKIGFCYEKLRYSLFNQAGVFIGGTLNIHRDAICILDAINLQIQTNINVHADDLKGNMYMTDYADYWSHTNLVNLFRGEMTSTHYIVRPYVCMSVWLKVRYNN